MIVYRLDADGGVAPHQLDNIWEGAAAVLCGGGPSLVQNDLTRLTRPGVLTLAINNAARHFRPTAWISSDDPRCFDPWILLDPGIMKFANIAYIRAPVGGRPWGSAAATYFYKPTQTDDRTDSLKTGAGVPWCGNTFMHALHLLYAMGVRRIGLLGSEFGAAPDGRMYAHETGYSPLQEAWNADLYRGLAADMVARKLYFDARGLTIVDASTPTRICPPYQHVDFDALIAWATAGFPTSKADPLTLPHCSAFAPERLRARVVGVDRGGDPAYSDKLTKRIINVL